MRSLCTVHVKANILAVPTADGYGHGCEMAWYLTYIRRPRALVAAGPPGDGSGFCPPECRQRTIKPGFHIKASIPKRSIMISHFYQLLLLLNH